MNKKIKYEELKRGSEFSMDKSIYKVTDMLSGKRFLAIYIGNKENRDSVTYWGYVKNGDFSTDNELFVVRGGKIIKKHEGTGLLFYHKATDEYKNAIA